MYDRVNNNKENTFIKVVEKIGKPICKWLGRRK